VSPRLDNESFAVSSPLALLGNASYPRPAPCSRLCTMTTIHAGSSSYRCFRLVRCDQLCEENCTSKRTPLLGIHKIKRQDHFCPCLFIVNRFCVLLLLQLSAGSCQTDQTKAKKKHGSGFRNGGGAPRMIIRKFVFSIYIKWNGKLVSW